MEFDFKNKYAGKRCFLIGSGSSLIGLDLSKLKNEIVICVNQSFNALDFEPDFICIGDSKLYEKIKYTYYQMKSVIIASSGLNGLCGSKYTAKNLWDYIIPLNKNHSIGNGFFRHDLKETYKGYTVVSETALPFITYCGFDKCYMLGIDNDLKGYGLKTKNIMGDDVKQFLHVENIKNGFAYVEKYTCENGLTKIYNATPGGSVEEFERVKFEDIL